MTERLRAPFQYPGGKGHMIAKLLPLVPQGGRPYCEPYCGAASLFFARPPAPMEVLNDLNNDIVNCFRCLQNPRTFARLRHRLMWTPYARAELARALETLKSPRGGSAIDRAWALIVAHNQSVSAIATNRAHFGISFGCASGVPQNVNSWLMRLSMLETWHWRLMRTIIENRDSLRIIRSYDNPEAVFYIDPPYHPETRRSLSLYRHETDDSHHEALVELLLDCRGAVALSGYRHPVYERLEKAGWRRIDWRVACGVVARPRRSANRKPGWFKRAHGRTESLWLNPKALKINTQSG